MSPCRSVLLQVLLEPFIGKERKRKRTSGRGVNETGAEAGCLQGAQRHHPGMGVGWRWVGGVD